MESMKTLVVETKLSARGPLDGRCFMKTHVELSLCQTKGYLCSLTEKELTEGFEGSGPIKLLVVAVVLSIYTRF
jgi:hypothetical protein